MRRRAGLLLLCGLVLPLIIVANASAQGATLELTPKQGPAGAANPITVNGFGFSRVGPHIEGVKIRLNRRDAPVLKTSDVDTAGRFTTTFFIPEGTAPGEYLVVATQQSLQGRALFNTPGRAKFRVTAGSAAAAAVPGRGTSQTVVVLGTLMLALVLAAGGTLAVRRLRTPNRPLGS